MGNDFDPDNTIKKDINLEDMKPLIVKEDARNWLYVLLGINVAISGVIIVLSLMGIVNKSGDKTISTVECPATLENGRPTLLKSIKIAPSSRKVAWVRDFSRVYLAKYFISSANVAQRSLEWLKNHSVGEAKKVADNKLRNIVEYKRKIDAKFYMQFYADDTSDNSIRITSDRSKFLVEVDGFLRQREGIEELRDTPTVRLEIEMGDSTIENPEGLYVSSLKIVSTENYSKKGSGL